MNGAYFVIRINDHIRYLRMVEKALDGSAEFEPAAFDGCKLGQWLLGEGWLETHALGPEAVDLFKQLVEPHNAFHDAGHRALDLHAEGNISGTREAVTQMMKSSVHLINLLGRLDEIARKSAQA